MAKKLLSEIQIAQVAGRWISGEDKTKLAQEFGVHPRTITNALKEIGVTNKMRIKRTKPKEVAAKKKSARTYARVPKSGDDPLDKMSRIHSMLSISFDQIAEDPDYPGTESQRRKEMRETSAAIAKVLPYDSLNQARKTVERDAADMQEGAGPQVRKVKRKKNT